MTVRVEFFGIPRARAGVAAAVARGETLGAALDDLTTRFPGFAAACLTPDGELQPTCIVNLGGRRFTRDRAERLQPAESVLILSADAGG